LKNITALNWGGVRSQENKQWANKIQGFIAFLRASNKVFLSREPSHSPVWIGT
jgi:hypothetical protein